MRETEPYKMDEKSYIALCARNALHGGEIRYYSIDGQTRQPEYVKTEPVTWQLLINSAEWDADNLTLVYATVDAVNGYQLHRNTGFTYSEALTKPANLARGANSKLYVNNSGAENLYLLGETQLLPTTTGLAGYAFTGTMPQQSHFVEDKNPLEINLYTRALGNKRYELTDHLGNVRATVSDRLKLNGTSYEADLQSTATYYPFGMTIGGLSYGSEGYRFGFIGAENDNEISGTGNSQDHTFRSYDIRHGRYKSLDPLAKKFPALSPFQYAGNNPIAAIDLEGLEPATINPNTQTLVIVLQGYGGDPQTNKTQAQNAGGGLGIDNTGLGKIAQAASGATQIQVVTYASSTTKNTKEDVKTTIKAFKAQNSGGQVVLVGHSQGADNAVELVNEDNSLSVDLLITLDIKDASGNGVFSIDDDNIPSNVRNAINYYQTGEFIGGEEIDINDNSKTNGANILSPGSNHRSIDNDLAPTIINDINNLIQGKNPVDEANKRKLPTFNPSSTGSPDISGKSKSSAGPSSGS